MSSIYFTKQKRARHVNMLLFDDGVKSHYCLIKNLSRLVNSQVTSKNRAKHLCDGCLISFSTQDCFNRHLLEDCKKIRTFLPSAQFKNVTQVKDESLKGYILEVDVEYPKSLHDLHNDLLLLAQEMIPPKS